MASTGTGVVIGSHSLKVVTVRKKGPVLKLLRVANVKFDPRWADRPFDARKQEYVKNLLNGLSLKPGEAMMGLTGRDLIIRYTHVPPVPDWRLDMLMKFEIEEVSEQSGGEVSADWARLDLPEAVSGDNTILVSLAKNAALLPRIRLLTGAGLKVRGGCPNSIAMCHAFTSAAKIRPGEVTLLMHIGAENTDIAIQKDGRLLFARNVSGGGRLFTEAIMSQFNVKYDRAEKMKQQKADVTPKSSARYEDSLAEKVSNAVIGVTGQFVSMVHSSVMFCKAQTKIKDLSVDRVILTGGGANLRGLPDYLSTNLGMPVEVFDPTAAADASELDPAEAAVLEKDGPGLTVALGLASLVLERQAFHTAILPEEYRKKRQFAEREVFLIGAGVLAVALIAFLSFKYKQDESAAEREARLLQSRLNQQSAAIRDHAAARQDFRKAKKRWIRLRDEVRTGPALQRGIALVSRVIHERGFREIHVTHLKTDTVAEIESVEEDPAAEPVPPGEEPVVKHLYVHVDFQAEIQPRGRPPARVYSDFIDDLRNAVRELPGVTLTNEPPRRERFRFRLRFAPPEALKPAPTADGVPGEGE